MTQMMTVTILHEMASFIAQQGLDQPALLVAEAVAERFGLSQEDKETVEKVCAELFHE